MWGNDLHALLVAVNREKGRGLEMKKTEPNAVLERLIPVFHHVRSMIYQLFPTTSEEAVKIHGIVNKHSFNISHSIRCLDCYRFFTSGNATAKTVVHVSLNF